MPEGMRVVDAVCRRHNITVTWEQKPWASCAWYEAYGEMMPPDWRAQLLGTDAIFFGAVGWPATVPDHVSLWGSLLRFRREFDQYVNLRPVRLMPGIPSPLAGRNPGDIDFYVVRENTEGEYSSIGGRIFEGTERETVIQETVMTRTGVDRVLKFAFELAQRRLKRHLTSATPSDSRLGRSAYAFRLRRRPPSTLSQVGLAGQSDYLRNVRTIACTSASAMFLIASASPCAAAR